MTFNLRPRRGRIQPHLTERAPGAKRKNRDLLGDWDFEDVLGLVHRIRESVVTRFFASLASTSMEELLDLRCKILDPTAEQWEEVIAAFVKQRGKGSYSIPPSQLCPERFERVLGPCLRQIRRSDEQLFRKRPQPILVPLDDMAIPLLVMWLKRPPILDAEPGLYCAPFDSDVAQVAVEVLFRRSGDAVFDFIERILNHLDYDADSGLTEFRSRLTTLTSDHLDLS